MIGIYKITNPHGEFYIGKSKNIEKRWKSYKRDLAKGQKKLNISFKNYGINNHKFEIIELCDMENLTDRENYHIEITNARMSLNSTRCFIINLC